VRHGKRTIAVDAQQRQHAEDPGPTGFRCARNVVENEDSCRARRCRRSQSAHPVVGVHLHGWGTASSAEGKRGARLGEVSLGQPRNFSPRYRKASFPSFMIFVLN
jgi:hypothetical protein